MRISEAGREEVYWGTMRELRDPEVIAEFTIDGEPASKSRARFTKRGSKTFAYTPEATKAAEQRIAWLYRSGGGRPHDDCRDTGYGAIAVFFCAQHQRRDVDNMLKLVLDGLNGIAWPDDSQVLEVTGRKAYVTDKDHARTHVLIYRAGDMNAPQGKCLRCGKAFRTYRSTVAERKYCGQECAYAHRTERRTRCCEWCKEEFQASGPAATTRFCSEACETRRANVEVACEECGATFLKPRSLAKKGKPFCQEQCRREYWRKFRAARAVGTCADCGGPTSKKAYTRCRGCAIAHRSGGAA